jgi:hypothetical protein
LKALEQGDILENKDILPFPNVIIVSQFLNIKLGK